MGYIVEKVTIYPPELLNEPTEEKTVADRPNPTPLLPTREKPMGYQPKVTEDDRALWREQALNAEWQRMEELDARAERFWASVHAFWERYDRGEPQPQEPQYKYPGNPPTGGTGVKPRPSKAPPPPLY